MSAEITEQGQVTVEGRTFKWAYDTADMLEVWNWQYGRSWAKAEGIAPATLARRRALELIAARDEKPRTNG